MAYSTARTGTCAVLALTPVFKTYSLKSLAHKRDVGFIEHILS
jgi:hypothetical protein